LLRSATTWTLPVESLHAVERPQAVGDGLAGREVDAVHDARQLASGRRGLRLRPDGELAAPAATTHRVDEDEARRLARMQVREDARHDPAVRVAHQNVRRGDAGAGEQLPKVADLVARVAHARRGHAVAEARAVIRARPRRAAELRLHGPPLHRVGAEAGFQDDGGTA
jgi:hypothetical protein